MNRKIQSPMHVAVIDDEIDLVYLFKDALSQIDRVQVFAFTDPEAALEHFEINQRNYRVVVADYRMPVLNGIQLFDRMKAINPEVTLILISAFEIEDKVFQHCQCIDKFLQKPVSMVKLVDEVEMSLDKFNFRDRSIASIRS